MASRFCSLVFIIGTGLSGLSLPLDLHIVTAQVQTVQDHKAEADKLIDLGDQQIDKSQYQQALRSYQSALNLYRLINNPKGKAIALFKLGYSYHFLEQFEKAIEYNRQSLEIFHTIKNRAGEGKSLWLLGTAYYSLGQYEKAISYSQRYLGISRETNNRADEERAINILGSIYSRLGQYEKAIFFHSQQLKIAYEIKDRGGEAAALVNIGSAYQNLGQHEKAIVFFQQYLAISQEIKNLSGEALALNSLGNVHNYLGKYSKAINFHQRSLEIARKIQVFEHEGAAISGLGNTYQNLGQYEKAINYYRQSLDIFKRLGSREGEAETLNSFGQLFAKMKQLEVAILFYKQSVNLRESIRKDIRGLDKELQKSYLSTVESTYRNLADLLLKQDRILEAQQVLDLLKVQELSDYLKTVRGNSQTAKGVDIQRPEQNIIALGNELAELQKLDRLTSTQEQRLAYLTNQESDLNQQFNAFLQSPEVQKQIKQLSLEKAKNVDLEEYNRLRESLSQVKNAALFYPLILDDRLELILITATTPPIRKTVNLKREELNKSISDFMSSLRDPSSSDVKDDGQKFYNYLIKPFEKELEEAKIQTIIYAPDGQLRYIPLAALYDGKQWLVERYRINNITASSLTNLRPRTYKQPRVLAAAATNSQNVNSIAFGALPATKTEVEAIASLIPRTTILLDRQFNKTDTVPKMQSNTIVHLATHGYFAVGQPEESFIVFGDSSSASIADIKKWTLTNVELVVLSACETAIGGKVGNGIEILGLGYQIQSAGAGASIASLWKVSDAGTQALMQKLYESLKQKDMSSSEALRQAQIAMIHSDKKETSGDRASIRVVGTLPNATSGKFSHPFYWSAFILIGNGL